MPSRFFIYSNPRSGSYHLASLLNSAPDIVCYKEIFKPQAMELSKEVRRKLRISKEERNADPLKFLDALHALEPAKHFGFKLFPNHVKPLPRLRTLFTDPDWKIVALTRRPVERFASLQKAKHYKYWTSKQATPAEFETKIPFDTEAYDQFVERLRSFRQRIKRIAKTKDLFLIDYSELDDPEKLQALLNYIGSEAPAASLTSEYREQAGPRPLDMFENPEEVLEYAKNAERARLKPKSAPEDPL